jgi:hypothetical protein
VDYIQWNSTGTGSLTDDTVSGSTPNEQVSSNQTPITATVNGSEVTFSGLPQQNGTLANGTLTLQVLAPDGTLGTDTFRPATQSQFNSAVQALQGQAASDNNAALQQARQASSASANAAQEQQAQSDLSAVHGIGFSSDLSALSSDVNQANTDLATTKSDAAQGPDGPSGVQCENASTTTYNDAATTVYNDQQTSLYNDAGTLSTDIATARSAIRTLRKDLSGLSSAGLPAPAGASASITTAQNAISSAISTANGDIGQVNADVVTAYRAANSIATGTCAGQGPGNPPTPIPGLS